MSKLIDLTGKTFGRLTVIRKIDNNKWGCSRWLCKCDCKKEVVVRGDSLKNGDTRSCGCLRAEIARQRSIKHGHRKNKKTTATYESWSHVIQRCTNHNNKRYKDYGGRGITICEEWSEFPNFLRDMGERPSKNYSIHRINNDKGYYKENCRWATRKEQARNRRNNHLISCFGKIQCIAAWAEETKLPKYIIAERLKRGWSTERALTTPIRKQKKK